MKNKISYSIDEILPKPSKKRCTRRRSSFKSSTSLQSFECYFEDSSTFCKCKSWKEATILFDLNVFSVIMNNKTSLAIPNHQLLCVNDLHEEKARNIHVITVHVNVKVGHKQKEGIVQHKFMCRRRVDYCLIFEKLKAITFSNSIKLHNEVNPFELKYNTLPRVLNGYLILSKIVREKCFDMVFHELQSVAYGESISQNIKTMTKPELTVSSRNQASELKINNALAESSATSIENLKSSECDEWGTKETDFKTKMSSSLYHRFTTFFTKLSS